MSKKIILVTGGAGYIGSITTKTLLDNNYSVVVLDNLEKGHREAVDKRAVLEVADLADENKVDSILKKYKPDAIIDFAAYIAVGESMELPDKYLKNNVVNFVKLLDQMTKNGIKYLIKSSTAAVYGIPAEESDMPLVENYTDRVKLDDSNLFDGRWNHTKMTGAELFEKIVGYYEKVFSDRPELELSDAEIYLLKIPTSVYGVTKMLDEILMKKYDRLSGIKSIILRYFNVAGADPSGNFGQDNTNPTHIFANAIFQALGKRDKLSVFGTDYPTKDGTGIRDYIHVNDLATGHVAALKYLFETNKSGCFNLGTGKGYSVIEVIQAVERASGKKINYDSGPRRAGDVPVLCADPAKANIFLGWKARYSLDDMASSAWKWHFNHPNGYK